MKAYIFDLDGTLLDSMGLWAQIDVEFLGKRGLAVPPDYIDTVCSKSFPEAAAYTISRFGLPDSAQEVLREWHDMAAKAYGSTIVMKPGARKYLLELTRSGVKIGIATSLTPGLYGPALRRHGIEGLFDAVCSSEEVGCGKTRPDIFYLAAKRLGVSPSECVMFEDILEAVISAKAAGMTVYGVYDKYSEKQWERIKEAADGVIYDFKEAPRQLTIDS